MMPNPNRQTSLQQEDITHVRSSARMSVVPVDRFGLQRQQALTAAAERLLKRSVIAQSLLWTTTSTSGIDDGDRGHLLVELV